MKPWREIFANWCVYGEPSSIVDGKRRILLRWRKRKRCEKTRGIYHCYSKQQDERSDILDNYSRHDLKRRHIKCANLILQVKLFLLCWWFSLSVSFRLKSLFFDYIAWVNVSVLQRSVSRLSCKLLIMILFIVDSCYCFRARGNYFACSFYRSLRQRVSSHSCEN